LSFRQQPVIWYPSDLTIYHFPAAAFLRLPLFTHFPP
jgi:hypothetical protein